MSENSIFVANVTNQAIGISDLLKRQLPIFGNWCGWGWSAGEWVTGSLTQTQLAVGPKNGSPLDAACKAHDIEYDRIARENLSDVEYHQAMRAADGALIGEIQTLKANGQLSGDALNMANMAEAYFKEAVSWHSIAIWSLETLSSWNGTDPLFTGGLASDYLPQDPLVLDLDGDGFALTAIDPDNPVYFDIDEDQFAESVGWVGAGDALLAIDRDGSGAIEGIDELFGDAVTNAFDDLATLDTNADGKIDSGDAEFANLRVWRDLDRDGTTDAGELQTMAQAGIASVSLAASPAGIDVNGNIITRTAAFTRSDGTTGTAGSVNLLVDQSDVRFEGPWGPYCATAEAMPELRLAA